MDENAGATKRGRGRGRAASTRTRGASTRAKGRGRGRGRKAKIIESDEEIPSQQTEIEETVSQSEEKLQDDDVAATSKADAPADEKENEVVPPTSNHCSQFDLLLIFPLLAS